MTQPLIDVTIAVHSLTRPIRRAVASVLNHTTAAVRVIVVAHNIDVDAIRRNLGEFSNHPSVTLLALKDGIPSPAGPMNLGFAHSVAPFITLLGSDDEFAPHALDSWLAVQHATDADAVLPRMVHTGRTGSTLPPVRNGGRRGLVHASRDRLSYRSAPLGLINREKFTELRFTEGVSSGEDLAFSAELWFTSRRVAVDASGPAYVVHNDADDRVTASVRTLEDDFAFLSAIDSKPWFLALRSSQRVAVVSKLLRVQFFDALAARLHGLSEQQEELRSVYARLLRMSPGARRVLSRVDRKILDEAFSQAPDAERIRMLMNDRWNSRSLGALLTRNPVWTLHPQSMLRLIRAANRVEQA